MIDLNYLQCEEYFIINNFKNAMYKILYIVKRNINLAKQFT